MNTDSISSQIAFEIGTGGARLSGVQEKLISSDSALAAEVNLFGEHYPSG
jgi:hypothetical protein